MTAPEPPLLLSAENVLARGYGRYWQFTTTSKARGALDPEAVYVLEDDALGLEELLTRPLPLVHRTRCFPTVAYRGELGGRAALSAGADAR